MKVRNVDENFFSARRLRGGRIGAAIVAGVAMVALAAMMPAVAHAQPVVTLSPTAATNPTGATHTVTAQVTGVCAETDPNEVDSDGEGSACTSGADCDVDEFCDFSGLNGLPIGFLVTGPNAQDNNMVGTVDGTTGQATFQYTGVNEGTDTIQACLDTLPEFDDATTSSCLDDSVNFTEDIASNQVTKTWIAPISGTVVLSPTAAVNPDNPYPANHTVTAQVSGIERCAGGGGGDNNGALCSDDSNCTGAATCSDPSGVTVGFEIESGPNAGDKGWFQTDSFGVATLTYTSNGVAGVDSIRACLDGDPASPGVPDENTPLVSECIGDVGTEADFASEPVTKRWDPTLALKNKDAITGLFSTDPAYNPVGTSHTVQATIVGAANICSGTFTVCSSDADCGNVVGSCSLAGYPVFFGVVSGPNTGDIAGSVLTDANGVATKNYTDTAGAGLDTIQACVDADLTDPIPDDADFTQCLAEYPGEADVPSNKVLKYWLSSFVTGGGKWTKSNKSWDSFGGTVGQKPGSTDTVGEWDETAHASKGGNVSCHWNTFNSLAFSCTNGPCGTTPDTVQFVASAGKCSGAPSQTVTVTIVDGRKKPDTIKVTGGSGLGNALNSPFTPLGTGNFTLHP